MKKNRYRGRKRNSKEYYDKCMNKICIVINNVKTIKEDKQNGNKK